MADAWVCPGCGVQYFGAPTCCPICDRSCPKEWRAEAIGRMVPRRCMGECGAFGKAVGKDASAPGGVLYLCIDCDAMRSQPKPDAYEQRAIGSANLLSARPKDGPWTENLKALGIRHTGRLEEDLRRKREECDRVERALARTNAELTAAREAVADAKTESAQLRRELAIHRRQSNPRARR